MVIYIQEFFETLMGSTLPTWFYNVLGLLICMNIIRGFLELAFPKLTKATELILVASVIGYIAYEVLPVWGIAIQGVS